ncbi:hypothetical protein [Sinorhizobium medicae]|uniref:Twin-arginine translocation signal domain-containing protein n=1 Tax=Sinorhizobium medicae TaxID=110321 RepID=A0ABX4TCM6_9HYPH|nr:hypothetical protein [Sinorhizobium medicae]PLT93370.1 hypothetical protein BMJ33_32160 [Sinorhizobium medicae]PLU11138.1 hypothetical protein BMJ29_34970 [Sinorhizobium medicae]PLU79759.1 hypothetical protein BMJ19_11775 [Sinorhizobium medicae]
MDEPRKEHLLAEEDRREFLKACGRFAAITPPAITMLLTTSLTSKAIASSGSGGGSIQVKGEGGGKGSKGANSGKGKFKPGR